MVDKTQAMFKWTEKATQAKENAHCNLNLTAVSLKTVFEVVLETCVMLCRNISTSSGLVNGAVGAMIMIKKPAGVAKSALRPIPALGYGVNRTLMTVTKRQ